MDDPRPSLEQARALLASALDMLDAMSAQLVAIHVDMALARLDEMISRLADASGDDTR
jgi:hypothetical protein